MTDFVATQVSVERAALRLISRPDVGAAVEAWAGRWQAGTDGFIPDTYAQLAPSIREVVLLVALQVVNGDPRRPEIVEISAGPHHWGGLDVPGGRWGINNPDTLYFAAPIEPASSYVLRGVPTAVAPTDINVSVQTPDVWGTLDSIGRTDLVLDADGGFSIMIGDLSGDEPSGGASNHLPIRAGGGVLMIRQTLADWAAELPYALSIERVAGPSPVTERSVEEQAQELVERLGVVIEHSLQSLQPPIFRLPANAVPQPGEPGNKPGYLVAQRNTLGHFRLADPTKPSCSSSRPAAPATPLWRHPTSGA